MCSRYRLLDAADIQPRDVYPSQLAPVQTRDGVRDMRWGFAGRTGKGLRHPHGMVGGIALQTADFDRLALGRLAHAGLFAQRLCRADAGTHAAENVLRQDRLRRSIRRTRRNLPDEQRNIDRGGASRHARRIMAEIAAISRNARLVHVKGRLVIGKVVCIGGGGQTRWHNAGRKLAVGQGRNLPLFY